jgi:tRNA1(Val) A37 N6-methylase TrmN6
MKSYKVEPKRLRLVAKTTDKEPWLVLVEGRLGGGEGLRVMPTLYLYNEKGELTEEMLGIYGEYANQNKITKYGGDRKISAFSIDKLRLL